MSAVLFGADETVSLLLSRGASPNKTTASGDTALVGAIQSMCPSTVELMASVTRVKLGIALGWLADSKLGLSEEIEKQLVERATQDSNEAITGLIGAAKFGSSRIILRIAR